MGKLLCSKGCRVTTHCVVYYVLWFFIIVSAAQQNAWVGLTASLSVVSLLSVWEYRCHQGKGLIKLIVSLTALGYIVDSALLFFHLIHFQANPFHPYLSPPWMVGCWLSFALVCHVGLKDYFHRHYLMGTAALIGFPAAYYVGIAMHAAHSAHLIPLLITLGIIWSILFPVVVRRHLRPVRHDHNS